MARDSWTIEIRKKFGSEMASQTYKIGFDGYWREPKKGGVPTLSGIYCVYTCIFDFWAKKVSLHKLIYIGEAENVNSRIANHEKHKNWESHMGPGEQLCYNFAYVTPVSRGRCEAALVYKHKPPENTEYANVFPFDQTTLYLTGKAGMLHRSFTVYRA